jgi:hypothetical protein
MSTNSKKPKEGVTRFENTVHAGEYVAITASEYRACQTTKIKFTDTSAPDKLKEQYFRYARMAPAPEPEPEPHGLDEIEKELRYRILCRYHSSLGDYEDLLGWVRRKRLAIGPTPLPPPGAKSQLCPGEDYRECGPPNPDRAAPNVVVCCVCGNDGAPDYRVRGNIAMCYDCVDKFTGPKLAHDDPPKTYRAACSQCEDVRTAFDNQDRSGWSSIVKWLHFETFMHSLPNPASTTPPNPDRARVCDCGDIARLKHAVERILDVLDGDAQEVRE